MMRISELEEGMFPDDGFNITTALNAILWHYKQQIDSDFSKSDLLDAYRELKSNLKFPLKIYRSLSFGDHSFDAQSGETIDDHFADWRDEDGSKKAEFLEAFKSIDFNRIGRFWTWDRAAALSGGALGGGDGSHDGSHVILEATIPSSACDMLVTLYQNLTVYEEEKEVRLFPDTKIKITGMWPNPHAIPLPISANTGPEDYDDRAAVIRDLNMALRSRKAA